MCVCVSLYVRYMSLHVYSNYEPGIYKRKNVKT